MFVVFSCARIYLDLVYSEKICGGIILNFNDCTKKPPTKNLLLCSITPTTPPARALSRPPSLTTTTPPPLLQASCYLQAYRARHTRTHAHPHQQQELINTQREKGEREGLCACFALVFSCVFLCFSASIVRVAAQRQLAARRDLTCAGLMRQLR